MASNQTANFGLNQWSAEDKVLREEFNNNFKKIDQELGSLKTSAIRIATGSYTGTGQSGAGNPCVLNFEFEPILLIVKSAHNSSGGNLWICDSSSGETVNGNQATIAKQGNTVQWYAGDMTRQLNETNVTYLYVAIG